jgi:hypothetical protein
MGNASKAPTRKSIRQLSRRICRLGFAVNTRAILFLAVLLCICSVPAHSDEGGVFVLYSAASRGFDGRLLRPTYVRGIALQIGWRDVEPKEGEFHWEGIDKFVALAREAGKRLTIHLLPLRPPEWVFQSGAVGFSFHIRAPESPQFGRTVKEAVPWDSVYLDKWSHMVRRLGDRYRDDPVVFGISVAAPAPEMVLPGTYPPGTDTHKRMRDIYDRGKYYDAWVRMIDLYQESFPSKYKFVVPGVVLEDARFADQVLSYAHAKFANRLMVFHAGLRAILPSRFPPMVHIYDLMQEYGRKANLGLQTIWSATHDPHNRMQGPFADVLRNAVMLGASYLEIYAVDVANPALQRDLVEVGKSLAALK